jgi:PAS domain S-box-containing protein
LDNVKKPFIDRLYLFRFWLPFFLVPIAAIASLHESEYVSPLLAFLTAVTVCGLLGGFLSGFVATVISLLLAKFYFIPPYYNLNFQSTDDVIRIVIFFFTGIIFSWLSWSLQKARRTVENQYRVLLEKERFFQSFYGLTSVGIGQVDTNTNKFVTVNNRLCSLTGYSSEELLQKSFQDITHPEDRTMDQKKYRELLRGEADNLISEKRYVRKDGSTIWVRVNANLIFDEKGRPLRTVGIVQDISEQKKTENDLLQAKLEAENANLAKNQFIANVSHEIRTPLGSILGFTELMCDKAQTDVERSECIQSIIKCGKYLLYLVDDILDLSKIEAQTINIMKTNVRIRSFLEEEIKILAAQAEKKGLQFSFEVENEIPEKIYTDRLRLKQIISNVIGNAIKFTQQGVVAVKIRGNEKNGKKFLEIFVKDTGIGLSKSQSEKLFAPFSQGDTSITRKFGGSGLGLFLSRRLANMLGGDIYIESSTPEYGSVFVICIEIEEEMKNDLSRSQSEKRDEEAGFGDMSLTETELQGFKVLVVDDVIENRTIMDYFLRKSGAQVMSAKDGVSGVELAQQNDYDVIIMDIQMPNMNGLDAATELRRRGYNKPIIALTAQAMIGEKEKCLKAGFNDYLTKPVPRKKLVQIVARVAEVN